MTPFFLPFPYHLSTYEYIVKLKELGGLFSESVPLKKKSIEQKFQVYISKVSRFLEHLCFMYVFDGSQRKTIWLLGDIWSFTEILLVATLGWGENREITPGI